MADEQVWTKGKIKSRIDENELDLSLCGISRVPVKNMLPFTKVTVLDLSCNKINILPDIFCQLTNLVQIDLSKNSLTELPEDFGCLLRLKKLDLLQNHLIELPISIRNLKQLQWLDLKGNPIQEKLPNVVGDCLKAAECSQCARNVVRHYEYVYNEKIEKERKAKKREEVRLIKQQKEEDAVRQRRKLEKKRRLEEQKKQNEANNETSKHIESHNGREVDKTTHEVKKTTSSCFRIIFYLLALVLVNMVVLVVISKGDMQLLQYKMEQVAEHARTHFYRLKDAIK